MRRKPVAVFGFLYADAGTDTRTSGGGAAGYARADARADRDTNSDGKCDPNRHTEPDGFAHGHRGPGHPNRALGLGLRLEFRLERLD